MDLLEQRLKPPNWDTACKLTAMIAQAESGPFNQLNIPHYLYDLSTNMVVVDGSPRPNDILSRIATEHKNCGNWRSTTAEYWLLKEVQTLESFGEEIFQTKPNGSTTIGVGPHGISVYEGGTKTSSIPFTAIQSAQSEKKTFTLEYLSIDNKEEQLSIKLSSGHLASSLYRAITEKHAFYSCETVRTAVTEQFVRDLKGTIASIFYEDSSLGKKYVFDIKRTCREVYDNARRALYVGNQIPVQNIEASKHNGCEREQYKVSNYTC